MVLDLLEGGSLYDKIKVEYMLSLYFILLNIASTYI